MIKQLFILTMLSLTLSACNISGSASKGPFKSGSTVTASKLNKLAVPIASTTITTQVSNNQGRFSVDHIKWKGWAEVTVEGQYFDEFNNIDSSEAIKLNAITKKDRRFDNANVHLFSHLAAARIRNKIDNGQNRFNAWRDTQIEIKQLFGLSQISRNIHRGVEQLDPTKGSGRFRRDNANLLLFTGSFLASGGNAASVQALTEDFADDAQFNGVGAAVFNAIAIQGNTQGLLETLSQNLIANGASNPPNNGDMSELPVWVTEDNNPQNQTPVAENQNITVDAGSLDNLIILNGTDADGDTLIYVTTDPTNGSLSGTPPNVSYTPNAEFIGSDSFTFTVNDGLDTSVSATVSITVNELIEPNNIPVAIAQSVIVDAGSSNNLITLDATDDDGDSLIYATTEPNNGSLSGTPPNISYTPNTDFFGSDSFTFTVNDGLDTSVSATVSITVNEVIKPNNIPVADAQSVTVDAGSINNSITLNGTDADGDSLIYATTTPANGSLTGNPPNLSYTPNPEFFGLDSFTFTVTDGLDTSIAATVSIAVNEVDEPNNDINVTGFVRELNGVAISGVSLNVITMNGQSTPPASAITDANGYYSLSLESGAKYTLDIVKFGYSTQIKTVTTLENDINEDFALLPISTITNFDQGRNFKAIGKLGTSVSLTANSFENVNLDDIIEVSITSLDKLTLNSTNALAGNATGMLTGNDNSQPLYILGATEFSFVNMTTNSDINLAAGQTAIISIPLLNLTKPDETQVVAGQFIPLFSLNEDTGIWEQEGDAEIVISESSPTGLAATATVSHFSWWSMGFGNPPNPANVAFAIVSVAPGLSTTGTASLKARTDADVAYQPDVTTFQVGQIVNTTFPGWNDTETCFWAEILDNGNIFTTPEECVIATAAEGETFEIILGSGVIPPLGIRRQLPLKSILGQVDSSRTLIPTTLETIVNYSLTSGSLPAGVSLTSTSATTAIISGSPTTAGTYNFDITAIDSENNEVVLSMVYEVTDAATSPVFIAGLNVESLNSNQTTFEGLDNAEAFFNSDVAGLWLNAIGFTNFTLDLTSLNVGAVATSWDISSAIDSEPNYIRVEFETSRTGVNPAAVEGISISNSGILTVDRATTTFLQFIEPFNFPLYSHTIKIRASNINGSSIIILNLIYDAEARFIKVLDGFNQ